MFYQQQPFIGLIHLWNFWSLYIHEMPEGYKKKYMWEWNWPLYNLSTNSKSACRQEREREKHYIHTHTYAQQENYREDGRTDKRFNYKLSFFFFLLYVQWYSDSKRGRESDRHRIPLRQHSTHKFFLFIFSYAVLDDGVQKILFVVDGVESSHFFSSLLLPSSPTPSLTTHIHIIAMKV